MFSEFPVNNPESNFWRVLDARDQFVNLRGGGAPKGTRKEAHTQTLETIINEIMLIKEYCGRAVGMITSEKAPLIFSVFKILLGVREIPCLTQSKF